MSGCCGVGDVAFVEVGGDERWGALAGAQVPADLADELGEVAGAAKAVGKLGKDWDALTAFVRLPRRALATPAHHG